MKKYLMCLAAAAFAIAACGEKEPQKTETPEISVNPADQQGAFSLDPIGAGFIHGFTGPDIFPYLLIRQRVKLHLRHGGKTVPAFRGKDGHPCADFMFTA